MINRTLKTLTNFIIAACLLISCNLNSQKKKVIDFDNAFSNNIGFINHNNEFINITQEQLYNYWKNTLEIEVKTSFENVTLVKAKHEQGNSPYYILNASSTNGLYNISSKLFYLKEFQGFKLSGNECVCLSLSCNSHSGNGCIAETMCACTRCDGACKKTSRIHEYIQKSDFESPSIL